MKKKMKMMFGAWCLVLGAWGAGAGVPLRWTVETSRAQPAAFEAYQGETLDFEATLQSYGRPLDLGLDVREFGSLDGLDVREFGSLDGLVRLYWQTNGMGSAWWSKPATAHAIPTPQHPNAQTPEHPNYPNTQTVFRATWTPDCDVGAKAYTCFVGITGTVYHAAFQLRLRPSPGAVPNVIDQPPRVLDLANTVVINAPWPTDATIDASIRRVIHEDGITAEVNPAEIKGIVTDTVDRAYVEGLGISAGLTTNDVEGIVAEGVRDKRDKGDMAVWERGLVVRFECDYGGTTYRYDPVPGQATAWACPAFAGYGASTLTRDGGRGRRAPRREPRLRRPGRAVGRLGEGSRLTFGTKTCKRGLPEQQQVEADSRERPNAKGLRAWNARSSTQEFVEFLGRQ